MAQYSMALQYLQSSVDAYKASLSPTEDELHEHKSIIEKDLERFELRADNALQFSGEMEDVQAAMQTLGREAEIILTRIDTALRKAHQPNAQIQVPSQPVQENNSMAKLPPISLPQFNGSFEHWLSFIDQFDSAIENNGKLSKVQKLVYLKRCLRGSAEKLICNLATTEDNYEVARQILTERYRNERLIVNNLLAKVVDARPVKEENANHLRILHSIFNETAQSLRALGRQIDNDLMHYHLKTKMDGESRTKMDEESLGTTQPRFTMSRV